MMTQDNGMKPTSLLRMLAHISSSLPGFDRWTSQRCAQTTVPRQPPFPDKVPRQVPLHRPNPSRPQSIDRLQLEGKVVIDAMG